MRHMHPPAFGRPLKQGTNIAFIVGMAIFFSSCYTIKQPQYFRTLNKDTTIGSVIDSNLELRIQKGDILTISVSSMNNQLDEQFNATSRLQNNTAQIPGYQVDEKGQIQIHFLGLINAEGRTRKQLKQEMEEGLQPFLKDPIVTVQFANHKITVMGEVLHPQVINLPEEKMNLLEALVSSGDVKETANRKNILIIREQNNQKKVKILNLENHSIFNSPWYYLQPNDVVCVMADEDRFVKEEKRRKLQSNVTLIASTASLVVVILNFLLR